MAAHGSAGEGFLSLCERAGAWQILVSEPFYEMLPPQIRSTFERTEPMQFKNVTQFIPTYRFTFAERADRPGSATPATGQRA